MQTKQQAAQQQRLRASVRQAKANRADLKAMPKGKNVTAPPKKGGLMAKLFGRSDAPRTAQQSIPYREMFRDGICRVTDTLYTKTIAFADINYQLAQNDDKNAFFESYCDFLNYLRRTKCDGQNS